MPDLTPREQAVEAAAKRIEAYSIERNVETYWTTCLQIAECALSAAWPLAERAALDRAEKALRERASVTAGWCAPLTATVLAEAADLVASLRPEEPREGSEDSACRHCGEKIVKQRHNGEWAHERGPGSLLYRCDPAKTDQPYGLEASP